MRALTEAQKGYGYGLSAYILWGIFPLYFVALAPAAPMEILGWRILLSLLLCAAILAVQTRLFSALALLRNRRTALLTASAGVLVAINWGIFVVATQTGHVVDAALGYFINPLVTALLGVLVLRESLRKLQWVALGLGAIAVVVLVVAYGQFPYIALGLAFSFGLYGLVKKMLGTMGALQGLTLETLWVIPVAIALLWWEQTHSGLTIASEGSLHLFLMLLAGAVTSVPLLLFAAATRRLPLSTVGLMQYINPVLQALVGIVILSEPMPLERWWGFGIVVLALAVFGADALRNTQKKPK
ncbi:MAG: EamA family transporter RarD [Pontimonas sp.]